MIDPPSCHRQRRGSSGSRPAERRGAARGSPGRPARADGRLPISDLPHGRGSSLPLCAASAPLLRLWQYGPGASLWADEANLALNIIERPLGRLLGPLDYRQVAPPGWLLLEKAAVTLFGEGEHALRLIPLLGGLATLPLCWHVARRILPPRARARRWPSGSSRPGVPFIFFAAQVKPYSTDVAMALLLLALALAVRQDGPGRGPAAPPGPGRRRRAVALLPGASWSAPGILAALAAHGAPRARPGAPPARCPGRGWRGR